MNIHPNSTDKQLLALLQQHEDISAFVEIYNRYWDKLFNAAHKRVKDMAACEEIVQDVFTAFWEKNKSIAIEVGLSNYLYTAIRNRVVDFYRKQAVRSNFNIHFIQNDYDNSSEQEVILRDLMEQVEKSVGQLPDKCKSVYLLSRVEQQTNKEIALLLNISEKTVEGHLTKALKHLRIGLSDFLIFLVTILQYRFN